MKNVQENTQSYTRVTVGNICWVFRGNRGLVMFLAEWEMRKRFVRQLLFLSLSSFWVNMVRFIPPLRQLRFGVS